MLKQIHMLPIQVRNFAAFFDQCNSPSPLESLSLPYTYPPIFHPVHYSINGVECSSGE